MLICEMCGKGGKNIERMFYTKSIYLGQGLIFFWGHRFGCAEEWGWRKRKRAWRREERKAKRARKRAFKKTRPGRVYTHGAVV